MTASLGPMVGLVKHVVKHQISGPVYGRAPVLMATSSTLSTTNERLVTLQPRTRCFVRLCSRLQRVQERLF